jgi:hypothetical protein
MDQQRVLIGILDLVHSHMRQDIQDAHIDLKVTQIRLHTTEKGEKEAKAKLDFAIKELERLQVDE